MFTGLIETTGVMRQCTRSEGSVVLAVEPAMADFAVLPGDSVAVDGVCLTCECGGGPLLRFRAVTETLGRTTLADARSGASVNLERSLRPVDRLGGHFVLGHVDGIGTILSDTPAGDSLLRAVRLPAGLLRYTARKGSVAVDGVSLTIVSVSGDTVTVSLIPYSLEHTTLKRKRPGDPVNIECDVLARYIERLMRCGGEESAAAETLYGKMERLGF